MVVVIVEDFGDSIRVARKMEGSAARAMEAGPVLEVIAADMIRVTDLLWKSQGRRGGGKWKSLTPEVIKRKGNNQILYTSGSNPGYTPHEGSDILAHSVTIPGGEHQILNIGPTSIEFGSEVEYAGAQFKHRPFIRFIPTDRQRWGNWIAKYVTGPFQYTKYPNFGGGFTIRGAGGRWAGVWGK